MPKKVVKVVSTARGWGGCARSVTTIMRHMLKAGFQVEFIPFRNSVGSHEYRTMLANELKDVKVTYEYDSIKKPCDILLVYADDFVWEFDTPEMHEAFRDVAAQRKVMVVNYRRGKIGEISWTKDWSLYMFLNSTQEAGLKMVLPEAKTRVLAPCTELDLFLPIKPNYNNNLRIMRHSSQGDTKFAKDFIHEVERIGVGKTAGKDPELHLLPGPSFIKPEKGSWIKKYSRTADPAKIAEFLSKGNLFWYSLPQGYMDMGPRVILEAMAAGLPVIADNWGGAKDRITPETGWLCDLKSEHAFIMQNLTFEELKKKGEAAKERARQEFVPEKWIREIAGV